MPHRNELGVVRHRHDRLGFGRSHHLRGYPDQPGPEAPEPSGGSEAGIITIHEEAEAQVAEKTRADLTPYRVDRFDVPADFVTAAVSGGSVGSASADVYHENYDSETGAFVDFVPGTASIYNFDGLVGSVACKVVWGPGSASWATGCSGSGYVMAGAAHGSWWQQITVNTEPSGEYAGVVVGPKLAFKAGETWLVGKRYGLYVKATAPTANGDGTLVMTRTLTAADVGVGYVDMGFFVPKAYLPVGTPMWVGICPIDTATEGVYICGLTNQVRTGAYGSWGNEYSQTMNPYFVGWDYEAASGWYGRAHEGIWFDGNLPWSSVVATDGALEFSDDGLVFTPDDSTNGSVVLQMDGADEVDMPEDHTDPAGEPWTVEDGCRMLVRFKISATGSLVDAGTRGLTLEWNDRGGAVSAIAHFGDTADAAGIEITGDGLTDQVAKAIAADTWYWLWLDTRNPNKLRGKLFADGHTTIPLLFAGEPPDPDVEIDRVLAYASAVDDNYLKLTINAGNASGQQAVTIHSVYVIGPAHDGELVEEFVGEGDATALTYYASMPFRLGSLSVRGWGHALRVTEGEPEYGSFTSIDGLAVPLAAPIVAAYECDRAEDFDDDTDYSEAE